MDDMVDDVYCRSRIPEHSRPLVFEHEISKVQVEMSKKGVHTKDTKNLIQLL